MVGSRKGIFYSLQGDTDNKTHIEVDFNGWPVFAKDLQVGTFGWNSMVLKRLLR